MNSNLIALVLAAGLAGLTYHYIGRRLGYSNTKRVWIVTGSVFVAGYLILIITLTQVAHL